ncbi:hypothetical protein A3K63_05005 [Candidatus Micrarchaeota archaeon RBG_16_49_10]|nr:MAG: hypothetical protein A3K63_05005 [Candidatus Micrarchaeota archaeon RBG_16_49_10]
MRKASFNLVYLGIVATFLYLMTLHSASSQGLGVGINSYSITFQGTIFDTFTVTPRIINPSEYQIKVKVSFDCANCVSNVTLFGNKIGEKIDEPRSYFTILDNDVTVGPRAMGADGAPVTLRFSPKVIVKKYFRFHTPEFLNFFVRVFDKDYGNTLTIPYYTMFVGQKHMTGLIVAEVYWSDFGPIGVAPSVGSSFDLKASGVPLSSLIFLILLLVLIVLLILRRRRAKAKRHSYQPKKE